MTNPVDNSNPVYQFVAVAEAEVVTHRIFYGHFLFAFWLFGPVTGTILT